MPVPGYNSLSQGVIVVQQVSPHQDVPGAEESQSVAETAMGGQRWHHGTLLLAGTGAQLREKT